MLRLVLQHFLAPLLLVSPSNHLREAHHYVTKFKVCSKLVNFEFICFSGYIHGCPFFNTILQKKLFFDASTILLHLDLTGCSAIDVTGVPIFKIKLNYRSMVSLNHSI